MYTQKACWLTTRYIKVKGEHYQPSSKQIICFDVGKQKSVLPIVFYVPWLTICIRSSLFSLKNER